MKEPTAERIPQHKHCANCDRAFVGEGKYCSPECDEKRTSELKKKKNILLIIWGLAFIMMVYAIYISL